MTRIGLHLTTVQAIKNCNPMRMANPRTDCTTVMSFESTPLAKVDPSATVTIRSKAYHFAKVR
jgi:hypothetical protein